MMDEAAAPGGPARRMAPLAEWPAARRQAIIGVLTDIDDTLTTEGAITDDALRALEDLMAAGVPVIAVTGRSTGWSEPFATAWPLAAIVAENGAVMLRKPDQAGQPPIKTYRQDAEARAANFIRMQDVARRILREVPGARLAQDSWGRETDMAVDHSEFCHLPAAAIAQVLAIMRSEGMNATVSSIHINGWFGDHNKLEGAAWALRTLYGRSLNDEMGRWVYVGDSTNDQLMFQAFENSVGVANVRRFESELVHLPRYITVGERGAGFAEVARAVLEARQA